MAAIRSGYANMLNENRIQYMPSCLVVEMMTKLYSQVSTINISGNLHNVVPDLLILLRRLTFNLKTTADAYEESRIKFFIGDWKQDKLRARKLFFNLMSRLGYMSELLGGVEKRLLFRAIEEMTVEWSNLDGIMEGKCRERRCSVNCDTCRCFRSDSAQNWHGVMARTILELDAKADYGAVSHLLLVCYDRIRKSLLAAIEAEERKAGAATRFSPDKILCVSNEEVPIACPTCAGMTDSLRSGGTEVIRKSYGDTAVFVGVSPKPKSARPVPRERISLRRVSEAKSNALRANRRYLMPPSLADIGHGRR